MANGPNLFLSVVDLRSIAIVSGGRAGGGGSGGGQHSIHATSDHGQ